MLQDEHHPNVRMEKVSVAASIFFLMSTFPNYTCSGNEIPDYYNQCVPFTCGNMTFSFPFSRSSEFGLHTLDCGLPLHKITCDSDDPAIEISDRSYQVEQISLSTDFHSITVVDTQLITDLHTDGSCKSLRNLSISNIISVAPLALPSWGINLTLYRCHPELPLSQYPQFQSTLLSNFSFDCQEGDILHLAQEASRNHTQFEPSSLGPVLPLLPNGCQFFSLPVSRTSLSPYISSGGETRILLDQDFNLTGLIAVLREGFALEWPTIVDCEDCKSKNGRCGYDTGSRKVVCFCRDGSCPQAMHKKYNSKLIIGVACGCSVFLATAVIFLIFKYRRRTPSSFKGSNFGNNRSTEDGRNAQQFIKEYRSSILTNYSYNDLKKMTGGFKDKLGEGGSGNVYKGKMPDGRLIAVKILERSSHEMSHFMNEVATIGRIHHLNVIHLLGFCWDGPKQALVYEYMPHGSLRDLLSDEGLRLSVGLAKLLEIAIGVSHGIDYLHNGCDSRILHLDIKPPNVLLDHNLNPKISDFGLAKVHSRDRSAISLTNARGTIGYIAPEIFMRNMGNPSHKSDVYSFGMLLLDMVGGKKYAPSEMATSGEKYFPNWIYDKLKEEEEEEEEEEKEGIDSVVEEEVGMAKKMVMVALWCIQVDPRDRPSMGRVIEMLNGSVEAIQMPPKPFFFSPPRLQEFSCSNGDSDSTSLVLQNNIPSTEARV